MSKWLRNLECICICIFICTFIRICICIALHKVPTNLILRIYALEMIVHLARLSADPTVEFMPLNHQLIANLPLNNNPMNLFYDPSNITIAFIVVLIVNLRTWDWTIVISVLVNMVLADDAGLLGPLGSTHQSKWSHHGAAIKLRPQISTPISTTATKYEATKVLKIPIW